MKPHLRIAFVVAVLSVACARTESQHFPELEVVGGLPSGFIWQFQNGPDFYVYRATSPTQPEGEVGVYFGRAPSFKPNAEASPEIGSFAGKAVAWEAPAQPVRPLRRDALLPYRYSGTTLELKLHLWVQATSREQLTELIHALSGAKVRERSGPGPA
jgi:hypothetical protein